MDKNRNGHYRGLHFTTINCKNGKVSEARVFDTYKSSDSFENFINVRHIPKGTIIVAACKDDCFNNLTYGVK